MEREQEGRGTQLKNLVNPNLSEKASVWENMSVPYCFSFFFLLYALLLSLQQRAHLMETSWDTSKEGNLSARKDRFSEIGQGCLTSCCLRPSQHGWFPVQESPQAGNTGPAGWRASWAPQRRDDPRHRQDQDPVYDITVYTGGVWGIGFTAVSTIRNTPGTSSCHTQTQWPHSPSQKPWPTHPQPSNDSTQALVDTRASLH